MIGAKPWQRQAYLNLAPRAGPVTTAAFKEENQDILVPFIYYF